MNTEFQLIPLSHLVLSQTPMQVERRKERTKEEISDLAETIVRIGQLQPIIVRPNPFPENIKSKDGAPLYEIVAGEGRYLAAQVAGLETIEAKVRNLTDEQAEEVQLIENLQRKDLNELLEAVGFEQLMKRGLTAEEIAEKVGKSKRTIYTRLQLLRLGDKARAALREGKIEASIALLIARLDAKSQELALNEVLELDHAGDVMTYRQARDYLHREFTFRLDQAGFDTNDATLAPSAGACTNCPRRSGNQPELFNDIERADVCTDPACFRSKREAHAAALVKKAKSDGRKIIAGADAKKAVAFENEHTVSLMSAYARPTDTCYDDAQHRTYGQLMKAAEDLYPEARIPKLLKTPGGKMVEVFEKADALAKLKKVGIIKKHEPTYSPSRTTSVKSSAPKQDGQQIERKFRARLFRAMFDKAPTKPDRKAIEKRLAEAFYMGDFDAMDLCESLGWEDFNMDTPDKELAKLSDADLYRLLYVIAFVQELDGLGPAKEMLAAAKALKIDAAKIRKEVEAQEKAAKAAPAAAPAKAVKKKTARKPK